MEWLRNHFLKILGIGVLAGAVYWLYHPNLDSGWGHDGVSAVISSTTEKPPQYALHVLFIGNSFTFVHNIPEKLVKIASSDPGNTTQYVVQSVTRGGITLKELWDDGLAAKAIQDGPAPGQHWDYVVLQEVSNWAMGEAFIHRALIYTKQFDALIRNVHAQPLLELTWVDKPGAPSYNRPELGLHNPDYMYKRFVEHTYDLGNTLGAEVVPVGTCWQWALVNNPEIDLYAPDGHHPGEAGAYLAGLTFYRLLSGRDVTRITYVPSGVSPTDAQKLRAIVAQ